MAEGRAKQTLTGRDIGFGFTPLTIAADGVITAQTIFVVQGRVEEGTRRGMTANERVMAMDAGIANYVPDYSDWVLDLSSIKYKNRILGDPSARNVTIVGGADGLTSQTVAVVDPFEAYYLAYSYCRITLSTLVIIQDYTGFLSEVDWQMRRLNQLDRATLIPIDTGLPNPKITAGLGTFA